MQRTLNLKEHKKKAKDAMHNAALGYSTNTRKKQERKPRKHCVERQACERKGSECFVLYERREEKSRALGGRQKSN